MSKKRPSLGRGLNALLESAQVSADIKGLEDVTVAPQGAGQPPDPGIISMNKVLRELPVEFITRGKYQPRKDMAQDALDELAQSIRKHGVMQPVVVRPIEDKKYELIAGERRWRACQMAGLPNIPVVIKEVSDEAAIAMALIENIQREDLNPMEEAIALARLKNEFTLTQQEVAEAVGKSRVTITNLLRLMNLHDDVKRMLEYSDIEMGHARALLGLSDAAQVSAANTVVAKGLSVRQTEALVRNLQEQKKQPVKKADKKTDPDVRKLEDDLSTKIGAKVEVNHSSGGKGKLVINYHSLDELDGILEHIH